MTYGLCHCSECQRLDSLPVRLHGIPHARQPSMLSPCASSYDPPATLLHEPERGPTRPQLGTADLPLFGGGLQPDLF